MDINTYFKQKWVVIFTLASTVCIANPAQHLTSVTSAGPTADHLAAAHGRSLLDSSSARFRQLQTYLNRVNSRAPGNIHLNPDVSLRYITSVDRLDLRYPFAVPNAEIYFEEIRNSVREFDVSDKHDGVNIRDAALRFLNTNYIQVSEQDRDRIQLLDFQMSALNQKELMSLVWAAIHDRQIFDEEQRKNRTWEFIVSLGKIQRTYNTQPGLSEIDWNSANPDRRGYADESFKRLLSSLHEHHPDVVIFQPSNEMSYEDLTAAIEETHHDLWNSLSPSEKAALHLSQGADEDEAYLQPLRFYRSRLITRILATKPNADRDTVQNRVSLSWVQNQMDSEPLN